MDKLKPILAHKFWILCAIALLLPIIGWFLGTGKLAAAIDTRVAALNALSVPDGNQIPNESWMAKVQEIQDERQKRLETAGSHLWDEQQKYMIWPSNLRSYVKDKVFEAELGIDAEERYRRIYNVELQNLVQIVDPYRINEMTFKEEGKVYLDPSALVTLPLDDSIWPTAPPSSKEVWYLQEEMWLIKALLEAVRDVNDKAGADSIVKAPIKQIDLVQLQGGDLAALEAAATATTDMGAEGGGHDAMMSDMMSAMGSGMGEGGVGAAQGVDFMLAEEVGPNTLAVAADESGATTDGGDPTAAHSMPGDMSAMMMGAMGGMGGATTPNPLMGEKRYVDDDKTAPFKTRAFKMQVVMDQRKLQEFLAELTNSPFPVRIIRVHWAELNPDPRFAGQGTSYGGDSEYSSRMPGAVGGRGGMGGLGAGRGGMSMPGGLGRMPGGMGARGGMTGPMGARGGMSAPMGGRGGMPGMGMRGGMPGPMGARGGMPGPMGGRGGMPGGMGMRPGLPGTNYEGSEGLAGEAGATDLYSQAMMNPYLAQVVVGGIMTIYRSPEEMVAGAAEGATDATATDATATDATATDATATDPAATGAAPATDAAAPTDAVPADGALPGDGTATDAAAPDSVVPANPSVVAPTAPDGSSPPDAAATDPADSVATPPDAAAAQDAASAAASPDPSAAPVENPSPSQP